MLLPRTVMGSPADHLDILQGHRFLFVCGLHRSGTSLLFRCLRDHPLISGFRDTGVPEDEGQHLQTVYASARRHGGPGRFGFDPKAHLTETSPLVTDESRARLLSEWQRHWDLTKPVLLEKSPPNLIRTRFLQALFPSSSFLVLLRDPIAVSYATQKWTSAPMSSLIEHWLVCHEIFARDRAHLRKAYVVRYEKFVSDPAVSLEGIYSFLGLNACENHITVRNGVNDVYLAKWRDARTDGSRACDETETIRENFGERVAAFDYTLNP